MSAHSRMSDPSRLTVFGPLPSEVEAPRDDSILSKVLRRVTGSSAALAFTPSRRNSNNDFPCNSAAIGGRVGGSVELEQVSSEPKNKDEEDSKLLENENAGGDPEEHPRNLGIVLERIKLIAAKGGPELPAYRDNDFRQYWMPDSSSKDCYDCGEKFTTFRRRRHCRVCGQLFCGRCANHEIPDVSHAESVSSGHISEQRRDSELLGKASDGTDGGNGGAARTDSRYQLFSGEPQLNSDQQPFQLRRQKSSELRTLSFEQLREIWLEMNHVADGLELKIHRHRFRAFPDCVSGVEIVDWLLKREKAGDRKQATRIGQGLVNFKFLDCLTSHEQVTFTDEYVLFKPKAVTTELEDVTITSEFDENEEPKWLQDIQPLDQVRQFESEPVLESGDLPDVDDVFIQEFGSKLKKKFRMRSDSMLSLNSQTQGISSLNDSPPVSPTLSHAPSIYVPEEVAFGNISELEIWRKPDAVAHSVDPVESDHTNHLLNSAFQQRLHALLHQLQLWEGLSEEWHEMILSLATKVTENVVSSVKEHRDDMDVRQYVHVKKIPGGKRSDSKVIFGVVCTKHVAHRKMRQTFINPRILLYGAALEYHRADHRFSSLEPIMQQEAEFLKNYVSKLSEFKPDILLVERNVSRLAQDYLFEEGITLAANMKESVMNRIARCASADKFSIIDGRFTKPRLGTCSKIDVKTVVLPDGSSKPYMTFDGCPKHLGCTILIRGDSRETLVKVKRILRFIVFCQYNWRLERAFLLDERAVPPEGGDHHYPAADLPNDGLLGRLKAFTCSVSPFVNPSVPFLESDRDRCRILKERYGLPANIYWSKTLENTVPPPVVFVPVPVDFVAEDNRDQLIKINGHEVLPIVEEQGEKAADISNSAPQVRKVKEQPPAHDLLKMHFTTGITDPDVQKTIANFRAYGGRPAPKSAPAESSAEVSLLPVRKTKNNDLVDCYDIYKHQRLPILCSIHACESYDVNASFCVFPWILVIEFYGKNDLTLGDYLDTFCFRTDAKCPNQQCTRPIREHCRRFASGDAAVSVVLKDLDSPTGPPLTKIVTWTWCKVCGEAGPVVPLSQSAWSLSFAKYLDLRFHATSYHRSSSSCRHSLHSEHFQFFAFGHTVAAFKLAPIKVREICSPSPFISMYQNKCLPERHELIEIVKVVAVKGHNVFATISDHLTTFQNAEMEKLDERLQTLIAACRSEKQMFKDRLECLQVKLASPLLKFDASAPAEMDQLRDFIWDIEGTITNSKRCITETAISWSAHLAEFETAKRKEERKHMHMKSFQSTPEFMKEDHGGHNALPLLESSLEPVSHEMPRFTVGGAGEEIDEEFISRFSDIATSRTDHTLHHSVTAVGLQGISGGEGNRDLGDSLAFRSKRSVGGSGGNAVPLPFPPNEHFMAREGDRIPVIVYDEQLSSIIAYVLSSHDYLVQLQEIRRHSKKEFLRERRGSRNVSGDNSPSNARSNSPNSTELRAHTGGLLGSLREVATGAVPFSPAENSMSAVDPEESDLSDYVFIRPTETAKSKSSMKLTPDSKQQYIETQFADQSGKFYCRVYFPEEFHQLRSVVFPYGEDRFIRSLAHSVAWKAVGGKSGSTFSKTADGRFVLKQMSRLEVQSFMEFAPHYFSYLIHAAKEKKPTAIAKVVGVYRIGFRNSQTGAGAKQDLLIMENLFYGRKIQQVYDLKGSLRNRLASIETKSDVAELVLLDENFLKRICENPLYIRPHAKLFLRKALKTDTEFLASQFVMDYSLLVGIDDDTKEIVVGIIDYIRTFTWDKRLEMVVKSSGLLGGQGKLPTIVSPELYRSRFVEAMERYFLPVPDQSYGLARYMEGI